MSALGFLRAVLRSAWTWAIRSNAAHPPSVSTEEGPPAAHRRIAEPACTRDGLAGAIRQAEIIAELVEYRYVIPGQAEGAPFTEPLTHPFALVVSQDCDLDWDYKLRKGLLVSASQDKKLADKQRLQHESKRLHSVLCVPAYDAGKLRGRGDLNSNDWQLVRSNKHERYQFLDAIPVAHDLRGDGLPELAIDFKRYFAIPTEQLYAQIETVGAKAARRTRLLSPYREQVQARMFAFQSRVALPQDHQSEPES